MCHSPNCQHSHNLSPIFNKSAVNFGYTPDDDCYDYACFPPPSMSKLGLDGGGLSVGSEAPLVILRNRTPPPLTIDKKPNKNNKKTNFRYKKISQSIVARLITIVESTLATDSLIEKHIIAQFVKAKKDLTLPEIQEEIKKEIGNHKKIERNRLVKYYIKHLLVNILADETEEKIVETTEGLKAIQISKYRLPHCMRTAHYKNEREIVGLNYNKETGRAHYSGLMTCGSAWICPHCMQVIAERRRIELHQTVSRHLSGYDIEDKKVCFWLNGLKRQVLLMTLTAPHHIKDKFSEVFGSSTTKTGIKGASAVFFGKEKVLNKLKKYGVSAKIVSTEVTYGENGWHPHLHILLFVEELPKAYELVGVSPNAILEDGKLKDMFCQSLKDELFSYWKSSCVRAGLDEPSYEHGMDIRGGEAAFNYVQKYGSEAEMGEEAIKFLETQKNSKVKGLDFEMTYGSFKQAKKNNLSIMDLVVLSSVDSSFVELVKDYAEGSKGKRRLVYSKGLKQRYDIEELKDEEIMELAESETLYNNDLEKESISPELWRLICQDNSDGLGRVKVLQFHEQDKKDNGDRLDRYKIKLIRKAIFLGKISKIQIATLNEKGTDFCSDDEIRNNPIIRRRYLEAITEFEVSNEEFLEFSDC